MIADLKPYPEYKESGLPWLGRVPEHWSLLPNRALFVEVKDRNHPVRNDKEGEAKSQPRVCGNQIAQLSVDTGNTEFYIA